MMLEIWPGPMEGIAHCEFVRAVNRLHLVDRWMTPFFRVSQNLPKKRKISEFFAPFAEGGVPVTVQLMGVDPQLLGETGALFAEAGACGVNLNCGCPSSRVVSGSAGGGMLRFPEKIAPLLTVVKSFLPSSCELSVKLRAGWQMPGEMKTFLPEIASSSCVSKIFFHFRTVKEGYLLLSEQERLSRFHAAASLCGKIPLIVNGDFAGVEETESLCRQVGCAGAMIARNWLRDPYLLRRFRENMPGAEEGREALFRVWEEKGLSRGAALEAIRMLWGTSHPKFRERLERV